MFYRNRCGNVGLVKWSFIVNASSPSVQWLHCSCVPRKAMPPHVWHSDNLVLSTVSAWNRRPSRTAARPYANSSSSHLPHCSRSPKLAISPQDRQPENLLTVAWNRKPLGTASRLNARSPSSHWMHCPCVPKRCIWPQDSHWENIRLSSFFLLCVKPFDVCVDLVLNKKENFWTWYGFSKINGLGILSSNFPCHYDMCWFWR